MSQRFQVLALYKRILKIANTWEASVATETVVEREYIRKEAATKFRQNAKLTDPAQIEKLIAATEKRIAIGEHYRIPKALRDLAGKVDEIFGSEDESVKKFVTYYLAGYLPPKHIFEAFITRLMERPELESLFDPLLCANFIPRPSYEKRIFKQLVDELEQREFYDFPILYQRRAMLSDAAASFTRVFMIWDEPVDAVFIEEHVNQLSQGTTGLSSWQASYILANYCKTVLPRFEVGKVLELGAGCGFTGIYLSNFLKDIDFLLTDGDSNVLRQLESNAVNNDATGTVSVAPLNWIDFEMNQIADCSVPDVVIGADLVYDPSILPHLTATLSTLLHAKSTPIYAFIGCAIRNEATLAAFLQQLVEKDVTIVETVTWTNKTGEFSFEKNDPKFAANYTDSIAIDTTQTTDVKIFVLKAGQT
uniref:Complex1_LYR_dom domain-containing protein n=1 Tax=Panagrellus redivivus TaxID=6233 RepID=A0A7E4ZXN5_PANRE